MCDTVCLRLHRFDVQHKRINHCAQLLEIATPDDSLLRVCATEVKQVKVSASFFCSNASFPSVPAEAVEVVAMDRETIHRQRRRKNLTL